MTSADEIESQAALWLVQLDAESVHDKWLGLDTWLNASPRNRAAFLRLSAAWSKADLLRSLRPVDGLIDADLLAPPTAAPWPRRAPVLWRAAAAAVLLLAVAATAWELTGSLAGATYATGLGVHQRIELRDGSSIELNTDSQIRVRFVAHRREVILNRGEALFRVAHDPGHPFEVRADDTTVRAVGTLFSVRLRDAQRIDVLVTEGRVAIIPRAGSAPPAIPFLSAGEAATFGGDDPGVSRVAAPEMARRLAWTAGRLQFDGETLEQAVAQFNRYNRQQLLIIDPATASLRVGGTFQTTDPVVFAAALQRSFGLTVESDADSIHLGHAGSQRR